MSGALIMSKENAVSELKRFGATKNTAFDSLTLSHFAALCEEARARGIEKPKGYHRSIGRFYFDELKRAAKA